MNELEEHRKPYSTAIVKLLKGVVERNSGVWENIITYQSEIQEYISVIGLELILKKDEGFAFVKQIESENGETLGLVTRRQIGFEVSLVLVVLRQILEEFDSNPIETHSSEKFITDAEIKDEVELFLPEKYNRVKFMKDLNSCVKKAEELGFLKETGRKENETKYRIHRVIKEKITLDMLQEFKDKLQNHVQPV
ncbi:MAG: DUF4194 domain-containing protein [Dysgonamonadaceae bacterium]|jgi:hypothetical protein|nr:DUF4194 domain-containing protein [Dysgonamonadaceae bacterium]